MLNKDYRDILLALSAEKVEFLLVGAYALAIHGYPRATMDIDVWVMPSSDNADAVLRALKKFGAPTRGLARADFEKPGTIFQIGVAPCRIDIITAVSGLNFDDAYPRAVLTQIDGISIRVLAVDDLIINKRASGRLKDLADVEILEAGRKPKPKSRRKPGRKK